MLTWWKCVTDRTTIWRKKCNVSPPIFGHLNTYLFCEKLFKVTQLSWKSPYYKTNPPTHFNSNSTSNDVSSEKLCSLSTVEYWLGTKITRLFYKKLEFQFKPGVFKSHGKKLSVEKKVGWKWLKWLNFKFLFGWKWLKFWKVTKSFNRLKFQPTKLSTGFF